ncbi:asparagine synthase-related protein [Streptomyces sp. 4N509B]|uniref:asparagine synthase-related protein n=1 Tax=Streptomyces sp. 4N509B TaxID=3457413 RepID=UPI003FD32456
MASSPQNRQHSQQRQSQQAPQSQQHRQDQRSPWSPWSPENASSARDAQVAYPAFLVFPDTPAAEPAARLAASTPGARRTVLHASGRPWLVGAWAEEDVTLIRRGTHQLALVGGSARLDEPTRHTLGRALERVTTPHGLDAAASRLAGSCHLVASLDGHVRVQGSLSTARQVFHARVAGVTLAADSPVTLAPLLAAARLREDLLAAHLLLPLPWPLFPQPLWSHVAALAVGHWLELRPDGGSCEVGWWTPPDPDVPLAEAAGPLRDALVEAVAARAGGERALSCDLSGGLDSTSLCFLADATGTPLVTHHWRPRDPGNGDLAWARRAAAHLPRARHHVTDTADAPQWYDEWDEERYDERHDEESSTAAGAVPALEDAEGPQHWARNRAHLAYVARLVAADGSRRHLLGVGGDELFGVAPLFLWSLVRSDPVYGGRMTRRFRALNRWPRGATLRFVADRRTFARTLADLATTIDAPLPPRFAPPTGWGQGDPRMPAWATGEAVAATRRLLGTAAAEGPRPLHPDRAQHQTMEMVVHAGHAARLLNRAFAPLGVTFELPFLDDRVVETALAVRVADRMRPGRYKPVLTTALRGVVPDGVLDRRDKGAFDRDAYDGLRRNRERLAGLCDELRLAERGLVDAGALRSALHGLLPDTRHISPFENTLACESWLRACGAAPPWATARAASPVGGPR